MKQRNLKIIIMSQPFILKAWPRFTCGYDMINLPLDNVTHRVTHSSTHKPRRIVVHHAQWLVQEVVLLSVIDVTSNQQPATTQSLTNTWGRKPPLERINFVLHLTWPVQ